MLMPVVVHARDEVRCLNESCDLEVLTLSDEFEFVDVATQQDSSASESSIKRSAFEFFHSDNQVITVRHDLSYMESMGVEGVETNRSSIRLEWDKPLSDNLYVKFDGKTNIYWRDDRRIEDTGKNYEMSFPLREFYIQGSAGNFSGSIGRQIVIWGESEIAAVTDVISPRNISDFYFTSLDESRIGQDMAKLDYYSNLGRFGLIYVIKPKANEDPIITGDYNLEGYKVGDHEIDGIEKDISSAYGIHWKKPIANGDYSLMLAELPTHQAYYLTVSQQGDADRRMVVYPKYQFLGGAMNLSFGDLSVNLESAYKKNMPFQSAVSVSGLETRNLLETAMAVSYSLSGTSSFYIGGSNQLIRGELSTLENEYRSSSDIAAGISGSFYYELVSISYDFQRQLEDENNIHTLSSSYAVSDNLNLSLDFFVLTAENKEVFAFYEQKSVILRVEYQF